MIRENCVQVHPGHCSSRENPADENVVDLELPRQVMNANNDAWSLDGVGMFVSRPSACVHNDVTNQDEIACEPTRFGVWPRVGVEEQL